MKIDELIKFKKDMIFQGAVQVDWFYDYSKAMLVANSFAFHGSEYFGVEEQNDKKKIDTVSFTKIIASKMAIDECNHFSLAIADYGTGKSHLAVTLASLLSGKNYLKDNYNNIINNINSI
ncbi:MAG: hypothetical protein K6G26_13265, partial [Lachnospiraceae bacterium]|nr:hypothetical protein [Lachnospiraceae bacterium]